jgi:hypothetical protein
MVYDSKRRGKGRVNGYGVITISKDNPGRITVVSSYNPQLVASIRVIEGYKWRLSFLSLRGRFDRSNLQTGSEHAPQSQKDYSNNPSIAPLTNLYPQFPLLAKGGEGGFENKECTVAASLN